ncbi:MAG: immunoglobulin domain-containing protein [Deltaproteobacteria bacterium]|nr:immunoglobulin domain-containing protein [Deltaproteobacteria bacterium]MCB9786161.1 immunoglobulin domain-containing protein [Deltaproteobacteria bacterium]
MARTHLRTTATLLLLCCAVPAGLGACSDSGAGAGPDADADVAASPDGGGQPDADGAQPPAGAPQLTLLEPEADSVWRLGEPVPFSARVSDPDDPVTALSYALSADGGTPLLQGAVPQSTLSLSVDSLAAGSHVLTLVVTDPGGRSAQVAVALRVNRPPAGATVLAISPAAPTTSDPLLASVSTPATDPDGQIVTYRFSWTRDGAPAGIAQASVPASATARGQTWTVRAVPGDGDHEGQAAEASVVIANAPPTLSAVNLLPSAAATDSTLTCSAEGFSDADGDPEGYHFSWRVDGALVADEEGATLGGAFFHKGQSVRCRVAPWDGLTEGEALESAAVPVLDSPPRVGSVTLSPPEGSSGTAFTCTASGLEDPDEGDNPTLQTIWLVNGVEQPGTTSAVFTPAGAGAGTTVQCKVVPVSGSTKGTPVASAIVVLANAAPHIGAVIVGPSPATELTGVQCLASDLSDPDGDPVTLVVTWKVDGQVVEGEQGATLSGEHYAKGQTVTCSAQPSDGTTLGPAVASKFGLVIANAPPSLGAVSLGPPGATALDTLVCAPQGFSDPDGDPPVYGYAWSVDGAPVADAQAATLSGGFVKGASVVCTVTPGDGEADGETVSSPKLLIANAPPSLTSATLTPAEGGKLTSFVCAPVGHSDPDAGDPKVYAFRWLVDGEVVAGATGASFVPGLKVASGAAIRCEVTPSDGVAQGTPVVSEPALVENQAPEVGTVTVGPEGAVATTTLACVASGLTDADGDTVTLSYQWSVEDALLPGETGAILAGGHAAKDDAVRCLVVPSDGQLSGAPVQSPPLIIGNAPPTASGVQVTPPLGDSTTTFTCVVSGAADPDEDPVSVSFRWLVNGVAVSGAVAATWLPGSAAGGGDLLSCEATVSDGEATSAPLVSAPITLDGPPPDNQPPVVTAVAITPGSPLTGDALTCTASGVSDPEAQTVTLSYTWTKNNAPIAAQSGKLLPASAHGRGDSVRCTVTPSDGQLSGSPVSSEPVLIGNTRPVITQVLVSPALPAAGEALVCEAEADDADEDPLTLNYQWLVDGSLAVDQTSATVPQGTTQPCQTWTCLASASDDELTSAIDEDTVDIPGTGGASPFAWFAHHSFDPVSSPTPKTLSSFLSVERVATRIRLPAASFPYTLTKVRFIAAAQQTYELTVYADTFGDVGAALGTQTVAGTGTYQEVTLDTPLVFGTQQDFWLGLRGTADGMTVRGDGSPPADATLNLIYGCSFFLAGECFTVFEWKPFDDYADPFGTPSTDPFVTFGDLIIDAGGTTGAGCPP